MTRHPFFPPSRTVGEARAVIVEGGMLLAFVAAWTALYIAVCPLEAYASELTPWGTYSLSNKIGAYCFAAVFGIAGVVFLLNRLFNAVEPRRDDEPYSKTSDYGDYPNLDTWSQRK